MRQAGGWVVSTITAGPVAEKTKHWVSAAQPGKRASRKVREEAKKLQQNSYSAMKELARLINANFTSGDLLLGLDYSEAGHAKLDRAAGIPANLTGERLTQERIARADLIRDAAEHELALCIRRVNRLLKKESSDLLYVAVTADIDGDTKEWVRVHHHLVVPEGCKQAFIEKWEKLGYGGVSWTPLRKMQIDRTPIAEYLLRQVRQIRDQNKFTSSRNLVRPKAVVRAVASGAFLRVPKGCTALPDTKLTPELQYLKYTLPPDKIAAAADEIKRRRRKERDAA